MCVPWKVRSNVASMPFTIWPQIVNRDETRYDLNTQQYNLWLMKQNTMSNDVKQGIIPDNNISINNGKTSFILLVNDLTTGLGIDKNKKVSQKITETNLQKMSTSVLSKQLKKQCPKQKIQDLVDKCRVKCKQNLSFCLICNVECGSIDLLEEHKGNTVFHCRVCTVEFEKHSDLETHFFTHKPMKCGDCEEIFLSKTDLLLHKKEMHKGIGYQCDLCGKYFARKRTLTTHKNQRHVGGNTCKCVVCERTYPSQSVLNQHAIRTHTAFEVLECKLCNSLFLGLDNLKHHIKSIHMDSKKNAFFSCKTCGKTFKGISNLLQHESTHDNTECLCELCGQSVKGKLAMRNHMNLIHSTKKLFPCKYCSEQFRIRTELQRHYPKCKKNTRSIPDPVCCEICGKQYKSKAILKKHKEIHCDERPFKCEECGATFRQSVALKTHSRVHSSMGKYCCDGCGMTFKWKQTYDKHVEKCGKSGLLIKDEACE